MEAAEENTHNTPNQESNDDEPPGLDIFPEETPIDDRNPSVPVDFMSYFENMSSATFFEQEFYQDAGGMTNLVGRTIYGSDSIRSLYFEVLIFSGIFATLYSTMTDSTAMLLGTILHYIHEHRLPSTGSIPSLVTPRSLYDLTRMFGHSKKSLTNQLPMPKVEDIDEHAYVSPMEAVKDLLAFGKDISFLDSRSTETHPNSPRGKEIMSYVRWLTSSPLQDPDLPCRVIPLYLWEDDLDPSGVKKNRHNVWVHLLTIGPPEAKIHGNQNTYIIGLGPATSQHSTLERRLYDDYNQLARINMFYYGEDKSVKPTICVIYSFQCDRPAKAHTTRTLAGTSPMHCRFGYIGDLRNFKHTLPSCPDCTRKRLIKECQTPTCSRCQDWAFNDLSYPTPENLPAFGRQPHTNIRPLTFRSLRLSADICIRNMVVGHWKKKGEVIRFCMAEGMSKRAAMDVFNHGHKRARYARAMTKGGMAAYRKRPDSISEEEFNKPFRYPPTWNVTCLEVRDFSSTIMHQVFLGVVEAVFSDLVGAWLTHQKKRTAFKDYVNVLLLSLKSLKLRWLKAEQLSPNGKTGRYVSENHVAYAKVCKWLYRDVDRLIPRDTKYRDPPNKHPNKFTAVECRDWLKVRNIAFNSQELKSSLQAKILEIIQQPGGPPPILHDDELRVPVSTVEDLVVTTHAMVSRIMRQGIITEDQRDDMDRHIKVFLSIIHRLDRHIHRSAGGEKCSWIEKSNFITLLNIPEDAFRLGSLRLLWEGDGKGERALRDIKNKIHSLTGMWAINAVSRYYRERGLRRVMMMTLDRYKDDSSTLTETQGRSQRNDASTNLLETARRLYQTRQSNGAGQEQSAADGVDNRFVVYKNETEVLQNLRSGEVISCIVLETGSLAIAHEERDTVCMQEIEPCRSTEPFRKCGAVYHFWILGRRDSLATKQEVASCCVEYAVLLPCKRPTPGPTVFYHYLVVSNWTEMDEDRNICLSRLPQHQTAVDTEPTNSSDYTVCI